MACGVRCGARVCCVVQPSEAALKKGGDLRRFKMRASTLIRNLSGALSSFTVSCGLGASARRSFFCYGLALVSIRLATDPIIILFLFLTIHTTTTDNLGGFFNLTMFSCPCAVLLLIAVNLLVPASGFSSTQRRRGLTVREDGVIAARPRAHGGAAGMHRTDFSFGGSNSNMKSMPITHRLFGRTGRRDCAASATALRLSIKGNLEPGPSPLDRILFVPKWILRQVFRFVTYVHRSLFRALVTSIAATLTAVIIDPAVNRALANAVKDGLNMFLTQPQLKGRLLALQSNLSDNDQSLAKPLGEDFPKLLYNFLSGLILQGLDEELDRSKSSYADEIIERQY